MEPAVAERNWHPIETVERGVGTLLLRSGSGAIDPAYIGYQTDDGRWLAGDYEVQPAYFCRIPLFDAHDDGAAS